jgi:cytochrome b561
MATVQSIPKYDFLAKSFHWLIVAMLTVEFVVGWIMPGLRGATPSTLMSFHMSFGITIVAVMLLRFLWRFRQPVFPPEPKTPKWQEISGNVTHYLLYVLVATLPVTGWWLASAHGWSVTVFNLFTLPALVSGSSTEYLADIVHIGTGIVVLGLIGLHVLAALYHYYIVKDKVLQRMLPQ